MDRDQSERLGRAFNASVYGMLGVPALALGGLVYLLARNVRAKNRRDAARHGDPPDAAGGAS